MFRKCLILLLAFGGVASAGEVANGKTPKGTPKTIVFTEDLRLGGPDVEDEFYWGGLNPRVSVDDKGTMFITDPGNVRVLKIDAAGNFVSEVSGRGSGPGEFKEVMDFVVTKNGAVAFDRNNGMGRIMWFNNQMVHERNMTRNSLNLVVAQAQCSPSGAIFAGSFALLDLNSATMKLKQGVLNEKMEPLEVFVELEQPTPDVTQFTNGGYWIKFLAHAFKSEFGKKAVFNFDQDGFVYTGVTNKYEVTKWSSDMKTKMMVIKREFTPIPASERYLEQLVDTRIEVIRAGLPDQLRSVISSSVVSRAIEAAEIPPKKNPIFGLVPLPEGLMVVHDVNGPVANADLFDKDGVYVGQVETNNYQLIGPDDLPRMVFKNGFAYTIETDEEGDHYLIRYKYVIKAAE